MKSEMKYSVEYLLFNLLININDTDIKNILLELKLNIMKNKSLNLKSELKSVFINKRAILSYNSL